MEGHLLAFLETSQDIKIGYILLLYIEGRTPVAPISPTSFMSNVDELTPLGEVKLKINFPASSNIHLKWMQTKFRFLMRMASILDAQ